MSAISNGNFPTARRSPMLRAGMPRAPASPWCLRPRQTFWLLFAAGVVLAASQFANGHLGNGYETVAVARNLAATGSFANPFPICATGPTAIVPPLYPAFLALLIRVFGFSGVFVLVIYAITAAVHGLHAALLPSVSQRLFADRRPGVWAALLSLAFSVYDFLPQFETMYFAVALMLFCLLARRLPAALLGASVGLLALLNPASVFVTAPWTAYLLWRQPGRPRLRFASLAALAALAVLLPWTARNYSQFHAWFFVRDNMGLELRLANNDLAAPGFRDNLSAARYLQMHPGGSLAEARSLRDLGEAEYNRRQFHAALLWMRGHPARFLALTAARVRMFWFPDPEGKPWRALGIALATLLSAAGLVVLLRRREPVAAFLAAVWLIYPPLYYLNQADLHYRAPVLWITLLAAGYALNTLTAAESIPPT